jgi:ATP-dependent Clp protease ATP-binding subunit ClpX
VAVYNHYLALAERELDGKATDFGKQHVLLLGATGSGKTYLVKTLARFLNVPLSFASATSLVETGYVGTPVDTIVKNLLTSTNYDARAAQRGIVFVDEIDKIRRSFGSSRDVSGEGVQNGLLTLLDGCSVTVKGRGNEEHSVDTSQILFICSGAFVELDAIVRERLGSAEIGFKRSKKSTETRRNPGRRDRGTPGSREVRVSSRSSSGGSRRSRRCGRSSAMTSSTSSNRPRSRSC